MLAIQLVNLKQRKHMSKIILLDTMIQWQQGIYNLEAGKWVSVGSCWRVTPHGNKLTYYSGTMPSPNIWNTSGKVQGVA